MTNIIDPSAAIASNVRIGKYNTIGKNVVISGFVGTQGELTIGDCNKIHDNARIMVGPGNFSMGDWNVIHNHVTILGAGNMTMGHNCWVGQGTVFDCQGNLTLKNNVSIGMDNHIWTHGSAGELVEGCTLHYEKPTVLGENVWLVGNNVTIMPGCVLGSKSIILAGSIVTHNTEPNLTYAGSPAKMQEKIFWKYVPPLDKVAMMLGWAREFHVINPSVSINECGLLSFVIEGWGDELWVCKNAPVSRVDSVTYFDMTEKTYTKTLSRLERAFYSFLYGYRARFIPV
jgi:acetyltransferase-like isoleucine patch superfamily enzyme